MDQANQAISKTVAWRLSKITMTLFENIKPVLVAGFFLSASALCFAQQIVPANPAFEPEPAAALPPSNSDSSIVPFGRTRTTVGDDTGSLVIRLQQLEEEIRRLNGIVEEQQLLLTRLQDQSLERYVELDRRIAMVGVDGNEVVLDDAVGAEAADLFDRADDSGITIAPVQTEQTKELPGERDAYQAAYSLVPQRAFPEALAAFKSFLANYPFGRYASNAHYWLGELYLVVDPVEPELARQSFRLLLDQYPSDKKVPDALYKLGIVYALKGDLERSNEYLNRVISKYGSEGHPAAQLAAELLAKQSSE